MTNFFLKPFSLLFNYRRNNARSGAINQVTSLKPAIKGAVSKNPSPRAIQEKNLIADMLKDKQAVKPEARA